MVAATVERGLRTLGVPPVGALDLAPPGRRGDGTRLREVLGQQAGEDEGPAEALGFGDVAGLVREALEVRVRHGAAVDQEVAHLHPSHGALAVLGIGETVLASIRNSPPVIATMLIC